LRGPSPGVFTTDGAKLTLKVSISAKITLVCCGLSLLAILCVNYVHLQRITDLTIEKNTAEFIGQTELMAVRSRGALQQMEQDSNALILTPPFQGLINSVRNDGIDLADASTTAQWRQRLETIFASFLQQREYYTQLRYIGLADNGRELVRVDKELQGNIRVKTEAQLQQKGDEFYFKETMNLPRGELYFSPVTLNREENKIDPTLLPTLRVIQAVYDTEGRQFGIFVINVDYGAMLQSLVSSLPPSNDTFIVDSLGHYVYRPAAGTDTAFHFNRSGLVLREEVAQMMTGGTEGESFVTVIGGEETLGYEISLPLAARYDQAKLFIGQFAPTERVFAEAKQIQLQSYLLAIVMIALTLIAAAFFSIGLTRPLQAMRNELLAYGEGREKLDLPLQKADEIGDLARAFDTLITRLGESQEKEKELIQQFENARKYSVDGLINLDHQGFVIVANPASEKFLALTEAQLIGRHITAILPQMTLDGDDSWDAVRTKFFKDLHYRSHTGRELYLDVDIMEGNPDRCDGWHG